MKNKKLFELPIEPDDCPCIKYINKCIRKGRASYVCKNCGKDVSLLYFYYYCCINKIDLNN